MTSKIRGTTATFSPRPGRRFDILPRAKRRRERFMKHTRLARTAMVVTLVGWATHADANPARADEDLFLKQSHGVNDPHDLDEWRKKENRGGLKPYPGAPAGAPNPSGGLPQFGGSGSTSFSGPDLGGEPFASFRARMLKQKPAVDRAARSVLESRFDLTCKSDAKLTMSRLKPQPIGPTARLPKGVKSW
jgi:hypothetical protein